MKTKRRPKMKLSDLSSKDLFLLRKSYFSEANDWFCYGNSFHRLFQLRLVTEDNKISYYGKKLVTSLKESK